MVSSVGCDAAGVSPPLRLQFVMSAPSVGALPPSEAEVAVVGRSNVGKSSLINALAHRKDLAQTSKTPGRTRLINLFELPDVGTFVDLPGYGYAAVSKQTKAEWPKMIDTYLTRRDGLAMVMVLVDGEIGPTVLDLQMLDFLRHHTVPHQIVATKIDKVRSSHRVKRLKELSAKCMLLPDDVLPVSASTGAGVERLRGLVLTWLS